MRKNRRVSRKMAVAIIAVFIFSIIASYQTVSFLVTSFVSAAISLSVNPVETGSITSVSYPSSVTLGSAASLSATFRNTGNTNLTTQIQIIIKNSALETQAILNDTSVVLDMAESRTYSTSFTPGSAGAYYAIVNVTFGANATQTNVSFSAAAAAVSAPVEGGIISFTEEKVIPKTVPGEYYPIKIDRPDRLKIEEIRLNTLSPKQNVKIDVREAAPPPDIGPPVGPTEGAVFKHLEIRAENLEDREVARSKIKFKVDRSWIGEKKIDADTVSLYKLRDNWVKLPTNKISEDGSYVRYESESFGFSLFAIAGETGILVLEYPENLTLSPGQTTLVRISARNGDTVDLHRLALGVSGPADFELKASPANVSILPPNSSITFLLSVGVPEGTAPGNYSVDFAITNDRISKMGTIRVEVGPAAIEAEIRRTIENYEALIERLERDAESGARDGKAADLARAELERAGAEIGAARLLYADRDFAGAKARLGAARAHIEQAAAYLEKSIVSFGPLVLFFVVLLAAIILFALLRGKK